MGERLFGSYTPTPNEIRPTDRQRKSANGTPKQAEQGQMIATIR